MLNKGTVLQNRYRIAALLGQGGMGAVYRAWHLSLNMPLAIKEMVPQPGLDAATLSRAPVTPYRETRYRNPVEAATIRFSLTSLVDGAARKMVSTP